MTGETEGISFLFRHSHPPFFCHSRSPFHHSRESGNPESRNRHPRPFFCHPRAGGDPDVVPTAAGAAAGAPGFARGSASAVPSRVFTSRVSAPGLPGGPFRSTRPWLKATGEWRAEGSSLDEGAIYTRRFPPPAAAKV